MKIAKILEQHDWAERGRSIPFLIGLTTFGILALELALIRWTSSQIRVYAYFNNLVLIGAFLGMGLGVALGRRHPGLLYLVTPMLLLVSIPLALAEPLGLVHLSFPDHTVVLWGGESMSANWGLFARNLGIFLAIFTAIVAVFVSCGAPLGYLLGRWPVLRAYTADLIGSLLGIIVFALAAWLNAGPAVWLAIGVLPFAYLAWRPFVTVLTAGIIALGLYSAQGALFSPYNRIDLSHDPVSLVLSVNRDFHQYLHDVSDSRLADPNLDPEHRAYLHAIRDLYDLPFVVNAARGSALVVGAGTGNDVQAALRNGYAHVTSVDIDSRIIGLGRELHPEKPYRQAAVRTVVDDARSYFGKEQETTFDVVCYGLLDSHAMSSAMSTLRLDNYVYTEEGIRAAWQRVGPQGHLSLAISCMAGSWFFERVYWTVAKATGTEPVAVYNPLHGTTVTFIAARPGVKLNAAEFARRKLIHPLTPMAEVLTPSDDWPFLYIRPNLFPWGYAIVLAFVLLFAVATVPVAFELHRGARLDWPLFLMGAAFLLIETRGVTSMSLLFGSTWVTNAVIFAGIIVLVLLGNLAVHRWQIRNPRLWFFILFAAVAALYFFPVHALASQPLLLRALAAGLITGLPVGIAGVIVPMLLSRSANPAASLGSNLLGSVLGGCLEYYSMLGGLNAIALAALILYLFAYLALGKRTE